ncbi:MAG: extensin family protein [Polyangiaceae bacterium]|nr:extensin family protein [Polyangiaceae bacterium]
MKAQSGLALLLLLLSSEPAAAARKRPPTRPAPSAPHRGARPLKPEASSADHFSRLSPKACGAELGRFGASVVRVRTAASGIALPVRITGPLGSVRFRTAGAKSPYGLLDCRFVLALAQFSEVLTRFDVVSVRVDNLYRPRARLPGSRKKSQHAYGLAADITEFELGDGSVLNVEKDWQGKIGDPVCPDKPPPSIPFNAKRLREIACATFEAGVFHHMLTPNFNRAHKNHFHFDIQRKAQRTKIE